MKMALATALHHSALRMEAPREGGGGPRRPKPLAPLEEVAEPQAKLGQHSGIGNELVLALDVLVLHMVEQPVDVSALAFLMEAERTREAVRRGQVLRQKGRGRKKKRRKKKKLPRSSFTRLPSSSRSLRAVQTVQKTPWFHRCSSFSLRPLASGSLLLGVGCYRLRDSGSRRNVSVFPQCLVRPWVHVLRQLWRLFGRFPLFYL